MTLGQYPIAQKETLGQAEVAVGIQCACWNAVLENYLLKRI
jgi:hypothetical protein